MNKKTFLETLESKLAHLSTTEKEDILAYYDELITDKMDREGLSEEAIINELGTVEEIVKRVAPKKETKIECDDLNEEKGEHESRDGKLLKMILMIIVAVICLPTLIGLMIGAISIMIVFISSGVGLFLAGISRFGTDTLLGFYELGSGLMFIGVTIVLIPLIIKGIKWLITWIIKTIKHYYHKFKEEK